MYLLIRADNPEIYLGLWDDYEEKSGRTWQAGRDLSVQILTEIKSNCDKVAIALSDLKGMVVYEGPGSFTGLRISISVANALGMSYSIPVIGATGMDWQKNGIKVLSQTTHFNPISPVYGGEVFITQPRK